MKPVDVLKYYRTAYQFAQKTGMSAATFDNWLRSGRIPIASQAKLEHLTDGALKANVHPYNPEPISRNPAAYKQRVQTLLKRAVGEINSRYEKDPEQRLKEIERFIERLLNEFLA